MSNQKQPQKHLWFYIRENLLNGVEEGPFTSEQLLELAQLGKLKLKTRIKSSTYANGQEIYAESIPKLATAINQFKIDAEKMKQEAKGAKQSEKKGQELVSAQKHQAQTGSIVHANTGNVLPSRAGTPGPPSVFVQTSHSPTAPQHSGVVVNVQQRTNSFAISSMIVGIIGLFTTILPFVNLGFGSIALLLGVVGAVIASTRGGSGFGYAITGILLSLIPLGGFVFMAILVGGAAAGTKAVLDEAAKEMKKRASIVQQQDEKMKGLLSKFTVDYSEIKFPEKEKFQVGPVFRFRVTNNTGLPVKAFTLNCVYATPGRSLPWNEGNIAYDVPGGIENGESKTFDLSPNLFGAWANLKEEKDAVFTSTVVKLEGIDGNPLGSQTPKNQNGN